MKFIFLLVFLVGFASTSFAGQAKTAKREVAAPRQDKAMWEEVFNGARVSKMNESAFPRDREFPVTLKLVSNIIVTGTAFYNKKTSRFDMVLDGFSGDGVEYKFINAVSGEILMDEKTVNIPFPAKSTETNKEQGK